MLALSCSKHVCKLAAINEKERAAGWQHVMLDSNHICKIEGGKKNQQCMPVRLL